MLSLQRIDTAIEQALNARGRLPAVLEWRAASGDVDALRRDRERVSMLQAGAQVELDRIESESDDITRARERLEKQLKTVISPREAEALQHEMQVLAARRNELDDRGIELLEGSSAADEEISALDESIGRAEAAATTARERATVAERDADAALEALRVDREAAMASLDTSSATEYERRRTAFGGIAVATIDHGSCTACHMELSVAETDAIKRLPDDAIPECPHCARILVR